MPNTGDNGSDWAVVLPSYGMTPAQADMYVANKKAAQEAAKAAAIPKEGVVPEIKVDAIGDADVDVYAQNKVSEANVQLQKMFAAKATTGEMKLFAQNAMGSTNAWLLGAKAKQAENDKFIQAQALTFGKGYDLASARTAINKKFHEDIFEQDANGKILGHKNPNNINYGRNYPDELVSNDDNVGQWFKPSGDLEEHLSKMQKVDVTWADSDAPKGNLTAHKWKAKKSQFSEYVKDKGGNVIGEDIKNDEKDPTKPGLLPQIEFDKMIGSPGARADFMVRFNSHKDEIEKRMGQPINANNKNVVMRNFAYDLLKSGNGAMDGHSWSKEEKTASPQTHINIRNTMPTNGEAPQDHGIWNPATAKAILTNPMGMTKDRNGNPITNVELSLENIAAVNAANPQMNASLLTIYNNSNLPESVQKNTTRSRNKFMAAAGIGHDQTSALDKLKVNGQPTQAYINGMNQLFADAANRLNIAGKVSERLTAQDFSNGIQMVVYKEIDVPKDVDRKGSNEQVKIRVPVVLMPGSIDFNDAIATQELAVAKEPKHAADVGIHANASKKFNPSGIGKQPQSQAPTNNAAPKGTTTTKGGKAVKSMQ